jgi:hypothetical protein
MTVTVPAKVAAKLAELNQLKRAGAEAKRAQLSEVDRLMAEKAPPFPQGLTQSQPLPLTSTWAPLSQGATQLCDESSVCEVSSSASSGIDSP